MNLKEKPIFFDGAFGTYYFQKTNDEKQCEFANISDPKTVVAIHKEYIKAGADCIKTNTYGVSDSTFDDNLQDEIIKTAYTNANIATENTNVVVFADIGNTDCANSEDRYLNIAKKFIKLGAKNYLFETLTEFSPIKKALKYIKRNIADAYIIVSFAAHPEKNTKKGLSVLHLCEEANNSPDVDCVGLNCVCGPSHLNELISKLNIEKPIIAMPNAGYPQIINNRKIYVDNVDYFAEKILNLYENNVTFLGGCCGTTPKHIKAAKKLLSNKVLPQKKVILKSESIKGTINKQTFDKNIKSIIVELDPPFDTNFSFVLNAANEIKNAGADAISVSDSPLSKARADSLMTSLIIKNTVNIDVIPHITCRDKNHIALKGGLLAANGANINKVFLITGDPLIGSASTRQNAVFGFNSFELIDFVDDLNNNIFVASPLLIGAALNTGAKKFDFELSRALSKEAGGAEYFFTQPIFTAREIDNFIKAKKTLKGQIFAGIMPTVSYKNALFLNNEVTGIEVPEELISSLKDKDKEEAKVISLNYFNSIIDKLWNVTDGFFLMLPLKRIDYIVELINYIKTKG